MKIQPTLTVADRAEVLALFQDEIPEVEHNAVPAPVHDHLYHPVLFQARDDNGRLLGAISSCYTQRAVGALQMPRGSNDLATRIRVNASQHSMLDLLAVRSDVRRLGIGAELIKNSKRKLRSRGTEFWFGSVTIDADVDGLREFYERSGFTVLEPGQELPSHRGVSWSQGIGSDGLAYWFYRKLKPSGGRRKR